jgi:hypothetical protein
LFDLSWLVPPDLSLLKDEQARDRCDYQWQDFRFDLVALNITLADPEPSGSDAGAEERDGGAAVDATEGAERDGERRTRASGCSAGASPQFWATPWFFLGMCAATRLRRKRRPSQRPASKLSAT